MKINRNPKENIHEFTPANVDTDYSDKILTKLCPSNLIESAVDLMIVIVMSLAFGMPSGSVSLA